MRTCMYPHNKSNLLLMFALRCRSQSSALCLDQTLCSVRRPLFISTSLCQFIKPDCFNSVENKMQSEPKFSDMLFYTYTIALMLQSPSVSCILYAIIFFITNFFGCRARRRQQLPYEPAWTEKVTRI